MGRRQIYVGVNMGCRWDLYGSQIDLCGVNMGYRWDLYESHIDLCGGKHGL